MWPRPAPRPIPFSPVYPPSPCRKGYDQLRRKTCDVGHRLFLSVVNGSRPIAFSFASSAVVPAVLSFASLRRGECWPRLSTFNSRSPWPCRLRLHHTMPCMCIPGSYAPVATVSEQLKIPARASFLVSQLSPIPSSPHLTATLTSHDWAPGSHPYVGDPTKRRAVFESMSPRCRTLPC